MTSFKQSALSLAILWAVSSTAFAGVGLIKINGVDTTVADASKGFALGNDGDEISVTSKTTRPRETLLMNSWNKTSEQVDIKGSKITFNSIDGSAIKSMNGSSISVGNQLTNQISITSNFNTKVAQGGLLGGVIAINEGKSNTANPQTNTSTNVLAQNISVTVTNEKDSRDKLSS